MKYQGDRVFANYVHANLAIPLIYEKLGWDEKSVDKDWLEWKDILEGIDYVFKSRINGEITVQERFRDNYYGDKYNDITIRYRRDYNKDPSRHASEFFKIAADYFV